MENYEQLMQKVREKRFEQDVAKVDDKYLRLFNERAENYMDSAKTDYEGLSYGNAKWSYLNRREKYTDLEHQRRVIQEWSKRNPGKLDQQSMAFLDSFGQESKGILDAFSGVRDYFSQFDSEDSYKQFLADQERWSKLTGGYDPDKHRAQGMAAWQKYQAEQDQLARETEEAMYDKGWKENLKDYLAQNPNLFNGPSDELPDMAQAYRDWDKDLGKPDKRWSTEQQEIFGYLWSTDPQKADAYARAVNEMLNAQQEAQQRKDVQEMATDGFWGGALHTAGAILTAPTGAVDYIGDLVAKSAIGYIPGADGYVSPFEYSQEVTGGIGQSLNDKYGTLDKDALWGVLGEKGLGDLYGLGVSAAQSMLYGKLLGQGATLATFFGSAAASAVDEAKARGASDEQALTFGAISGAAEVLTEMVPLDHLLNMGRAKDLKGLFWDILKQGGEEALGEGANSIITSIADYFTFGEMSTYNMARQEYMAQGMTEEEASKRAFRDIAEDIAFDALGGFVTGTSSAGVQMGGATALHNAWTKRNYGPFQKELVHETLGLDPENTFAQKMQHRLERGKNLSGGQLSRLNDQIVESDIQAIRSAAANRLNELGETGNVDKLASALARQAAGEELTRAEERVIQNSKYGQRVAEELSPKNIRSGGYASEWAQKIGTHRVNAREYGSMAQSDAQAGKANSTDGNMAVSKKESTTQATNEDGVSRQISTGEEVTPRKIVSVERGKMMIQTDGGIIAGDDIEFGTGDMELLWRSAADFQGINASGANGIIRAYQNTIPVATYLNGAAQEYQNGYYNMESGGEYADKLTPLQRTIIYDLGQKAAGENVARAQAKATAAKKQAVTADKKGAVGDKSATTGKVHFDRNGRTFDSVREVSLKAMEQLSAVMGVEFHVYESYVNKAGERVYRDASGNEVHAPNGFYDTRDGSIHIDLNAGVDGKGTMLFTVAHELTHFIKQWSPEKFKTLADYLVEQYSEAGESVNDMVDAQIAKARRGGRDLSWEDAFEEMVADSMEAMLTDGNVVQMMADLKQQDKSLWQKIRDWFRDLVEDLKNLVEDYKGVKPDSVEGRMVAQMQDVIVTLEALYTDALSDASENYQAARAEKNTTREGDVKYSIRETRDGQFVAVVESDILKDIDTTSWNQEKKRKAQAAASEALKQFSDGIVVNGVTRVVNRTSRREYTRSKDTARLYRANAEVFADKMRAADVADDIVIAATNWSRDGGLDHPRTDDFVDFDHGRTLIMSGSAKYSAEVVVGITSDGTAVFYDVVDMTPTEFEIKNAEPHSTATTNESIGDMIGGSAGTNVTQKTDEVKTKFSDRDSSGNALSQEQQEYFKDSKVRDEQGRLMVMYHGTPNGNHTTFRPGTYFTPDRRYADVYQNPGASMLSTKKNVDNPKTYEVYLNVRKPFDTRNPRERRIFMQEYYRQWGTGAPLADSGLPDWTDGMDLQEFIEEMGYDYDGLILDEGATGGYGMEVKSRGLSYVVFSSEQVKDTSNKTPTSDPDIRYSDRDYQAVVNKAVDQFGTTTDFEEAGFILPDGKMLKFTDDKHRGERQYDHRAIGMAYGVDVDLNVNHGFNEASNKHMDNFVENGGIRFDPGSFELDMDAGMQLSKSIPPTAAQEQTIREFIEWKQKREEVYVSDDEFSLYGGPLALHIEFGADSNLAVSQSAKDLDAWGVKHLSYEGGQINASRIISDIRHYYKTGEARKPSIVAQFRYSDRDPAQQKVNKVLSKENAKLKEDVSYLKELVKMQKQTTGGTKFTKSSVEAAAGQLIKYADAKGSKAELAQLLNSVYEYIAGGRELTWEGVKEAAQPVLDWLQSHARGQDGQKTADGDYGYDQDLHGQELLRQIYDSYWNVTTLYTVADKAQREINRLKSAHAERMAALKQYHAEETARLTQEHREAIQRVRQDMQARAEKQRQGILERNEASRQRAAENRKKAAVRAKIRRTVMDLDGLLNKGDKKRNVKEGMQDLVSEALRSADILFTENYTNEDMIRNGVGTDLTEQESKYMQESREILEQMENLPSGSYEAFEARQETEAQLKRKLGYRMSRLQDVFARERARLNRTKISEVLNSLADAYASLQNSEQSYVSEGYHENVYQYLLMLKGDVGGTTVKDMTLNQLEELHKAYTMVLTTVRNANKMFAQNLKQTREQLGNQAIAEVQKAGGEHGLWAPGEDKISAFSWNNEKPVYAFERIGSETLTRLFENTRAGEDGWARDMTEARAFYLEQIRKHKYDSWNFDRQYRFTSSSGVKFSLNLEQIMSLYAYSKREQAHDHLLKGGFVFDSNTEVQVNKMGVKLTYLNKTAKAHNVSQDILADIVSQLTDEQKAFVDEMQEYLSATMGGKGNEVSLQLYGVKLFNEKHYFPLRSAGQYMERAKEADLKKKQGQISIVNSGFTKATTPKSSNPVVLSGFMDVWADHVNEMSMYHSFVLPMEDFRRVYNYSSPNVEEGQSISVNSVIQDAYGEAATGYIDQLYRDLNGGAVSDPRETPIKALMGKFKKAAVFASLSVVVQQPSSIGRAFAIINPKYFIGAKVDSKRHKQLWAELKQYAPVATIKEMGYFDTGMGKSAQDFIQAKEYKTLKEKAAALFTDADYWDELLGKMPALADELTWCAIWEAAKRETKAKNPGMNVKSEDFLQLAAKRFTEVVTKTQVYDSVLSRSANMRSKGAFMSMWTAFMAEPTTTINMVEDALRKAKKGNKQYAARAMGAVMTSVVINSLLASLVYAMRDDDEDETFLEKYVQSVATEILDGINPITYYPFLKDVWSVMQGYDIERSDMSLITSLVEKITKLVQVYSKDTETMDEEELAEHNKSLANAWWGVTDYLTALLGIPVKNVRRDINGAANMFSTISRDLTDRDTSWGSLIDKTLENVKNAIPVVGWLPDATAADKLYKATVSGDAAYRKRLESAYSSQTSLDNAIRKGLRANDSRIWEAAMAWNNNDLESYKRLAREIIDEGYFSQDNVVMAIQAEAKAMLPKESESAAAPKAKGYFNMDKFAVAIAQGNASMAAVIKADIIDTAVKNGKSLTEAENSFASSVSSACKDLYLDGTMSQKQAVDALAVYGGYDKERAQVIVGKWRSEKETGIAYDDIDDAFLDGEITAADVRNMYTTYGGLTQEEAEEKVTVLSFVKKNPALGDITSDAVESYNTHCESAGISPRVFYDAWKQKSSLRGSGEIKEPMLLYIDNLDLTVEQKDALYLAFGWAESKLRYTPWH